MSAPDETFYPARARLIRRVIWPAVLFGLLFVATASLGERQLLRLILCALSVPCGLLAAVRLTPLLREPRPVLVLTPDGFRAPALAADLVPWSAIAHLTPIVGKRSARLLLWLNAGTETHVRSSLSRRLRLRLGLARRSRLTLDLKVLDAKPWVVVSAMQACILATTAIVPPPDLASPFWPARVAPPKIAGDGVPFFTFGLVVVLVAVFVAEMLLAIGPGAPVNAMTL